MWPVLLLFFHAGAHQTALEAYKQHKFDEAVSNFTEALKTEQPGSAEYQESGCFWAKACSFSQNITMQFHGLRRRWKKSPTPEAAYMLGNACILTQQSDKAVKAFAQLSR